MTIRFRKLLQYMIYGSLLSITTIILSAFGGTKKTNQSYISTPNNPMEIPAAHADILADPVTGGDGSDGSEGEGDCEGEGEGDCA